MPMIDKVEQLEHLVKGVSLGGDKPAHWREAMFAMGCFWGAERRFWQLEGVQCTAVGYTAGHTDTPSYAAVCRGDTGHAEAVKVWFDPAEVSYLELLAVFWQEHDPTQGVRQGNDVGSQYRSGIYYYDDEQQHMAAASKLAFEEALRGVGKGPITTEIIAAPKFYYAEPEHQQYLARNPMGYCGLAGTGVALDQSRVLGHLKG